MFEKLQKKIALQITKITIWYNAWKEAREIVRAYNHDEPIKKRYNRFVQKHLREIKLGVVWVIIIGLVSTGTVVTLDYLKKTEPQRKATALVKKENARKKQVALQVKNAEQRRKLDSVKNAEAVKKQESIQKVLATKKAEDSIQRDNEEKLRNKQKLLAQAINDSIRNAQLHKSGIDSTVTQSSDTIISSDSAGRSGMVITQKKVSFFDNVKKFFKTKNYKSERKAIERNSGDIETISKGTNVAAINYPNTPVTAADTPVAKRMLQPPLYKTSFRADYSILVANKAQKKMYIVKQTNGMEWKVEKEYPVTIGAGLSGPKLAEGDKRTPEGIYFILLKRIKSELNEIYGPLAYVLNYPNEEDRKEGRTGQGIWIHGTKGDGDPVPTKGCISLKNSMMFDIQKYIADGKGTPVVIVNDSVNEDPLIHIKFDKINTKRKEILAAQEMLLAEVTTFLDAWVTAWESRDIDQYAQFYSEKNFNSQGVKWNSWKEKKIQTFTMYATIDVAIENVKLTDWTENSIEIKFLQNYRSDQKFFENGKKLLLVKDSLSWKIIRETTIPKEEILL
ncbi:MAG: L,D-transpeptidase family protein [Fibrobacter sp.]|nr:L,D-transpeptidase family protein [Fibrobacter sp.]